MSDLRFAFRRSLKNPGFTTTAVLTLALGIGATTALFTVVNGVLIRPLPYPEPDRLVQLYSARPERGANRGSLSVPDFRDWSERSGTIERMGLYLRLSDLVLMDDRGARELTTTYVSAGFLPTLGVEPALGRAFREEDETGDSRVLVLSHGFWTRQFGGDPSVVGRAITVSDRQFQVIGVMPEGFGFPAADVEVWCLLSIVPQTSVPWEFRGVRFARAIGRLAPGATPDQAREDLSAIADQLSEDHPETNEGLTAANVMPLRESLVGDVRTALLVLFGAVGLVLAIACVNVANLLLARGIVRGREIAMRGAMGASRWRLVRMLLAESLVLGLAGGVTGCVIGFWGVQAILGLSAGVIPRLGEIGVDGGVLTFALGVSLLVVLAFGLLPAVAAARSPAARLTAGDARVTSRFTAHGGLVAAEAALALVLLVGVGLLVKSLVLLSSVDPGFRADGALAVTLVIPQTRYPTRQEYLGVHDQLLDRLGRLPGVQAIGSIRHFPLRGSGEQTSWELPEWGGVPPARRAQADVIQVTPDLFRALGVPLVRGRSVAGADRPGDPLALVVNQRFVQEAFGDGEPLGRTVLVSGMGAEGVVVGVVGDVRHHDLRSPAAATIYLPIQQIPRRAMTFVLRVMGEPLALAGAVERAIHEVDPGQAISEIVPGEAVIGETVARPAFFTLLLGIFGVLAVMLAAIGVYGVLMFTVRQRTREIGIRMALGADQLRTRRLVVRHGMTPVAFGIGAGLLAAFALTRLMRGMLFEVQPLDLGAFAAATACVILVAVAACWIPAHRATRVDPMEALRWE
jgi:predicted permease